LSKIVVSCVVNRGEFVVQPRFLGGAISALSFLPLLGDFFAEFAARAKNCFCFRVSGIEQRALGYRSGVTAGERLRVRQEERSGLQLLCKLQSS
jgi:hypothetical protein